ncbi:hypothetical protein GCM10027446_27400 [Angustibacter peucedani]
MFYDLVAAGALAVGWWGVARTRMPRRWGWTLLLAGYSTWVAGDVVYTLENQVLHLDTYPVPSDAFYLAGYVVMGLGALVFVRSRRQGRSSTALLDAGIVTVGVAVPAAVFLIVPATSDSTLSLLGKLVASAYPLGDLFLLAVLSRLVITPGARTAAFQLLGLSLLSTLGADVVYQALTTSGVAVESRWLDVGWLVGYLAAGAAAAHPSMRALGEPPPDREVSASRRQLVVLTAASVLPGVTLVADGLSDGVVDWAPAGVGVVVLAALVLARMGQLLGQVQVQAVQLAALARVDSLTGAPNRRTWDHELSRACKASLERDEPLVVAILDLDHFKNFNDSFGHQEGDRLLRSAVAAWSDGMRQGQMIARYGGEEFAVLLPDHDLAAGRRVLDAMRARTPQGQTFSAGVAVWEPGSDPGAAVAAADAALYRAKRAGRDRVEVADDDSTDAAAAVMAGMSVVVQPILDAATGEVVGHEALTRFAERCDVKQRFAEAHACGFGDLLEGHAVRTALELPGRPAAQRLFVNASAAALVSSRFWDMLPPRLDGVVVEIVEDDTTLDWAALAGPVLRLRERGALIALDDLGSGASDLARLVAIRPDVVKLDRGLVAGCSTDADRARLITAMVGLANTGGAQVCAEGVEAPADLDALRDVGVHLAQGFLLGRPDAAFAPSSAAVDHVMQA